MSELEPKTCQCLCNSTEEHLQKRIASLEAEIKQLKEGIEARVEFYRVKLEKLESENGRLRRGIVNLYSFR